MIKVSNYVAYSLTEYSDGTYKITRLKLDQASRRVIPDLVDSGEQHDRSPATEDELLMAAICTRVADELYGQFPLF